MEEAIISLIDFIKGNLIQLIFVLILVRHRREFGIMAMLFLTVNQYANIPAVWQIVFYAITAVTACCSKESVAETMNHSHNVHYVVQDDMKDIRSELDKQAIRGDKNAIDKIMNQ